jgi:hypothetical protein
MQCTNTTITNYSCCCTCKPWWVTAICVTDLTPLIDPNVLAVGTPPGQGVVDTMLATGFSDVSSIIML